MTSISGSVGRGGLNQRQDVITVQTLLNKNIGLLIPLRPLRVDGVVGPTTIGVIEEFQKRVLKMMRPDGRVDPHGKTFTALSRASGGASSNQSYTLPLPGAATGLTEADFQRAATALRCEVACIKAVTEIESGKEGFFLSRRPKILFEAHVFSRQTNHQYDKTHPDVSSLVWNRALYIGGEKEYDRLAKVLALDAQAALKSASWGRFQIMGFNHVKAGFGSVESFVAAMYESEGRHLDAFISFLQNSKLDAPLREKRWADFARGYNGTGYAKNQYDVKIKAAYDKYNK